MAIYTANCPLPESAAWMEEQYGLEQVSNASLPRRLHVGNDVAVWIEGGYGLQARFTAYGLQSQDYHFLDLLWSVQDPRSDGHKVVFSFSPRVNGKSDTANNSMAVWTLREPSRPIPNPPGTNVWSAGYDSPWMLALNTTLPMHRSGVLAMHENGSYEELWPPMPYSSLAQGGPLRGQAITEGHAFLSFWRDGRLSVVDHDLENGTRSEIANWTAGSTSHLEAANGWLALPVTIEGEDGWWIRHVLDGVWRRVDTPAPVARLGGDVMLAFEVADDGADELVAYGLPGGERAPLLKEDGFDIIDWGTNGDQYIVLIEPRRETHLPVDDPQMFLGILPEPGGAA